MMTLKNWAINCDGQCEGQVYGNHNFPDGSRITTSTIVGILLCEKAIKTRSGSVYKLDGVLPDYEEDFPGAEVRFFTQANKEAYDARNN